MLWFKGYTENYTNTYELIKKSPSFLHFFLCKWILFYYVKIKKLKGDELKSYTTAINDILLNNKQKFKYCENEEEIIRKVKI